jgi:autotransporter-associated beta strand protein
MPTFLHRNKFFAAAICALFAVPATTALAQNTTWTGASGGNWTTGSNWSGGVAPVAGYNAVFSTNGSSGPNAPVSIEMDKITFATGGSSFSPSFIGWNVNAAGTFIEVQSGNTQAQSILNTRFSGGTILLKSGTSTILNNGSSATGLLVGSSSSNITTAALRGNSTATSTLIVDGSGTTTIGISSNGTNNNMLIADGNSTTGGTLSLTKRGSGSLTLNTANTFSGGLTLEGNGTLNLAHSNAAGTGTIFLKSTQSGPSTTVGLSGGITVANAIQIDSSTGREWISSSGTGDTSLTGGITISTSNSTTIVLANNQSSGNLTVSGGISGSTYTGSISLRGSQSGSRSFLNGVVTLSSSTSFFDINASGNWTLNTAGSTWVQTIVQGSGSFILGVTNALPTSSLINFSNNSSTGSIDLNGYNQSVAGITAVTPTTGNGGRITNGGTVDSILTLAGLTSDRTYNGTITDGATNKISIVMDSAGRTQTLGGINTYTGNTTVSSGTLMLSDNAQLLFTIGASGVNNQINGSGKLDLYGDFNFNLTGAAEVGSWNIVNVGSLTELFGSTFTVVGFTDAGSNIWTRDYAGSTYTFSESTGVLTAAGPEPSTWVLLALSLLVVVTLRRRRLV